MRPIAFVPRESTIGMLSSWDVWDHIRKIETIDLDSALILATYVLLGACKVKGLLHVCCLAAIADMLTKNFVILLSQK